MHAAGGPRGGIGQADTGESLGPDDGGHHQLLALVKDDVLPGIAGTFPCHQRGCVQNQAHGAPAV